MRRNRLIMILLMLVTLIIASKRGGTISYTLCYMVWAMPILSGLYLFYVYKRFCIYQSIDKRILIKGEKVPYSFVLSNEDIITYTGVNVKFYGRLSSVEQVMPDKSYSLTPGEELRWTTTLRANYRGSYSVGIHKAEVTDFLRLFRLTYYYPKPIVIRVKPRILHFENLLVAAEEYEDRNNYFDRNTADKSVPDIELRNYMAGDTMRMINWKASAREQELLSRTYTGEDKTEAVLICDLSPCGLKEEDKIIAEDKVIEASLAIADYMLRKHIPLNILYARKDTELLLLHDKTGMDEFYNICAKTDFSAGLKAAELLSGVLAAVKGNTHTIVVTHTLSDELARAAVGLSEKGSSIDIVYAGDDDIKGKFGELNMHLRITRILPEQEVQDVLDRKL